MTHKIIKGIYTAIIFALIIAEIFLLLWTTSAEYVAEWGSWWLNDNAILFYAVWIFGFSALGYTLFSIWRPKSSNGASGAGGAKASITVPNMHPTSRKLLISLVLLGIIAGLSWYIYWSILPETVAIWGKWWASDNGIMLYTIFIIAYAALGYGLYATWKRKDKSYTEYTLAKQSRASLILANIRKQFGESSEKLHLAKISLYIGLSSITLLFLSVAFGSVGNIPSGELDAWDWWAIGNWIGVALIGFLQGYWWLVILAIGGIVLVIALAN